MRMAEFTTVDGEQVAFWPDEIKEASYREDNVTAIFLNEVGFKKYCSLNLKFRAVVDEINAARNFVGVVVPIDSFEILECPNCEKPVTSLTSQGFCGHCSTMEG